MEKDALGKFEKCVDKYSKKSYILKGEWVTIPKKNRGDDKPQARGSEIYYQYAILPPLGYIALMFDG